jgi:acyl-coenzyme A thioesterase PaaI-like protein
MKQLSGLEFLEAIGRGDLPPAPMATLLGIEPVEVGPGRAVFAGIPSEEHYNPMGSVHGGYAATILDSAMGCAVHTTLPPGGGYSTLEPVDQPRPRDHRRHRAGARRGPRAPRRAPHRHR